MRWLSDPLNCCLVLNVTLLVMLGGAFAAFAPPNVMGPVFIQTVQSNAVPIVGLAGFIVAALLGIAAVNALPTKRAFGYCAHVGMSLLIIVVLVPPMVRLALA